MKVEIIKANNSRELTLKVLLHIAGMREKGFMLTNIQRVSDKGYLYAYEMRFNELMPVT